MMEWTDRPCRSFLRLLTRRALLYSEMIHAGAIVRGGRLDLLRFPASQHPLALQLGGNDAAMMAEAARIGEDLGYMEINLNAGCPSDRVQAGAFGASLMLEPELAARIVEAMARTVAVPVTVKCRLGVDDQDIEGDLDRFVDMMAEAGCARLVVHARKAWLKGLSPKDNRDIPPLDYGRVYRLKERRGDLAVIINGGVSSLKECKAHLAHVDGVMLGRAVYNDPYMLARVDGEIYGDDAPPLSRREAVEAMLPVIEEEMALGQRLHNVTRHMSGLYHGLPGARAWRRMMNEEAARPGAGSGLVARALEMAEAMQTGNRQAEPLIETQQGGEGASAAGSADAEAGAGSAGQAGERGER
jgi:tRNA-dihydrouridine synthase A